MSASSGSGTSKQSFSSFQLPSAASSTMRPAYITAIRSAEWRADARSWVIDSIERLVQRNVFSPSSIFNYSPGGTVYTRASQVAGQDGMVGGPYDALKQACYGAQRDRLLVVQYETLTTEPAKAMHAIYEFIDEPVFEHDFNHVDYDVTEFDERAGTPGLHTVNGEVKAEPRETVLPPDLYERFVHDAFWRDPDKVPGGLRVV